MKNTKESIQAKITELKDNRSVEELLSLESKMEKVQKEMDTLNLSKNKEVSRLAEIDKEIEEWIKILHRLEDLEWENLPIGPEDEPVEEEVLNVEPVETQQEEEKL